MVLAYSEATAAQLGNINRIRNATNTPARLAFEENLRVTKVKFTGSEQGFEAWAPEIWDETTHTEDQIERYLATHNTLYNLIQLNVVKKGTEREEPMEIRIAGTPLWTKTPRTY